jgi:hypothetical protein
MYAAAHGQKECLELLMASIAMDAKGLEFREVERVARKGALDGVEGCSECVRLLVAQRERSELGQALEAANNAGRGLRI